jgi:hypothetical protein
VYNYYYIELLKTDENGNKIWYKNYIGFGQAGWSNSIEAYGDGIITVGTSNNDNPHMPGDIFGGCIFQTDYDGNIIWEIPHTERCYANIQKTHDGNYIIAACPRSQNLFALIKIDTSGNVIWDKEFDIIPPTISQMGSMSASTFGCIKCTADNGFIFIGNSLVKTDSDGVEEWRKSIEGTFVEQTSDGGFIVLGSELTKTDSSGNTEWTKPLSGRSVKQTQDDGYILCGSELYKLDTSGNVEWSYIPTETLNPDWWQTGDIYIDDVIEETENVYIFSGRYWADELYVYLSFICKIEYTFPHEVEQIDVFLNKQSDNKLVASYHSGTPTVVEFTDDGTGWYDGYITIPVTNVKMYTKMVRKFGSGPFTVTISQGSGYQTVWNYLFPDKGRTKLIIGTKLTADSAYNLRLHITIEP